MKMEGEMKEKCKKKFTEDPFRRYKEISDSNYEYKNNDEFKVECILDKRCFGGENHYLIKWEGFSLELATWEEESKVEHLKSLINDFEDWWRERPIIEASDVESDKENPYLLADKMGHFMLGDEPKQIQRVVVGMQNDKKKIYMEISWNDRMTPNGPKQLKNTMISTDVIFDVAPKFLIDYYKSIIKPEYIA